MLSFAVLGAVLGAALVPVPLACSKGSDSAKAPPAGDASSSDDAGLAFSFSPPGCAYQVEVPTTRPFTNFALDDATPPTSTVGAEPVRVRLGLGGDTTKGAAGAASPAGYADPTTSASIVWETPAYTTNAKVRFGTSPSQLTTTQPGFVYVSPPPTVGFGTGENPANMHQVDVCGLTPGTTYYYQVGGGASGSEIWSATQSFTTVPAAGSTITVGVFGDSRDSVTTWQLVNQRMQGAAPNLLLVSGDIVDFGTDESLWTQWLDAVWNGQEDGGAADGGATSFLTLGQFITVPVPGNHENDSSQFFANFSIPGRGEYAKQYSSFDVGNTHFVLVDDEAISENPGSAEADTILGWLDSDLAAANADRVKHPFIVEINHRCLYSTSTHTSDPDVIQARESMAPLFTKYNVNLVLNGHDHEYERSQPLTAGSPPQGSPVIASSLAAGTTYVTNAGAGADAYPPNSIPESYVAPNTQVGYGAYSTKGYVGCYVLLTLEGSTLTLKAYGMKPGNGGLEGDDVIDSVVFGQ